MGNCLRLHLRAACVTQPFLRPHLSLDYRDLLSADLRRIVHIADGAAAAGRYYRAARRAYAGLGVIFTSLAQSLVVTSLRHLRAQTASVVFGLEPVYGILLA